MQSLQSQSGTVRGLAWPRPCIFLLVCLVGCATPQRPAPPESAPREPAPREPAQPVVTAPVRVPTPAPEVVARPEPVPTPVPPVTIAREQPATDPEGLNTSRALNPREYRNDAAAHLYQKFSDRIYLGKLPPLLEAVGVLELDIGRRGEVLALRWTRAPRQVPKVMAEIESMVRAAAPFPAPVRMGQISYTEVWLWHKSGRFQLDSLTEGQQ